MRKEGNVSGASLRDVYTHRPLQKLITHWQTTVDDVAAEPNKESTYYKASSFSYYTCWLAQTISLFFIYGLFASQIYLPYLSYYYVTTEYESHTLGILASIGLFCLIPPILSLISLLAKWLIIGKYKQGSYPLWGTYFFKWWLVEKLESLVQINFLNGTPIYRSYIRLKGAKIGEDAQLGALHMQAEDLIELGKNVSIGSNVLFNNVVIEKGQIHFSSIKIGDHVYVGSNSIIKGNTTIADWAEVGDLTMLPNNSVINKGEIYEGSPAKKEGNKDASQMIAPPPTPVWKKKYYYTRFAFLLFVFPIALLLPLVPVITLITELDNNANDYDFTYFVYIPLLALLYMVLFAIQTILVSRILTYKIKPGIYSIYSNMYFRKWLSDQFLSLSLIIMHPVFATVYVSAFFRALGAKIGNYSEISTANNVSHHLLTIGENSFIADNVNLGESEVRNQQLEMKETTIGDFTFIGNSAHVQQGATLPSNMLVGVLSMSPEPHVMQEQQFVTDWFGSPAVPLPNRQDSGTYKASQTLRPTKLVWLLRATVELIRIILPETILLMASCLFIAYVHDVLMEESAIAFALQYPFYFIGFIGLPSYLITLLLKWIFVQKYKPTQWPLWHAKVWISEAITSLYESIAVPFFLEQLRGTPWLPIALRGFGVKIGKRVYCDTTDFTEHDLTSIGNEAELNMDCGPQTHLFEDRVMKMGKIEIGDRVTIGAGTIILYDTIIQNNVTIESLSLVMKGEELPPNSSWMGSPLEKRKQSN